MTLRTIVLIAAVLAASGAAAAPKPAPHKVAPAAKPAAAAPTAVPATPSGPFDAREPASLIALLSTLGATGQPAGHDKEGVMVKVSSPAGGFNIQYAGCNQQGRVCAGLQFDASAEAKTATLAEINAFNQSSLACRIYQDKAGKPHVLYSSLVFASTTRADMLTNVNAWRGCLSDFGAFLKDPPGYLASAP